LFKKSLILLVGVLLCASSPLKTSSNELSDQMGRSGLAGEIDTKFWDKYGMTLLFSTISAVAQFKFNTNKNQEIIANT
jgi:type IV secretory pathway VirB10-like protein